MTKYNEGVWKKHYRLDDREPRVLEFETAVDMFAATAARTPDAALIRYFDGTITARELDELTDAFAVGLQANGFQSGERVVIYAQNIPQFVIAQLGTWKAGGIAVSANPMYRERELGEILTDSGATVLVAMQDLYRDVAQGVVPGTDVRTVITTSGLEYQSANRGPLAGAETVDCPDTVDMATMIAQYRGQKPPPAGLTPDSVAFLTYTSGTTGPPKGAMTTHRNVVFTAQVYRDWIRIDGNEDVILAVAPLFHVTGLIGHVALCLLTGAPMLLMYRMDPAETLRTIEEQGATFTVGSITVFTALMGVPDANPAALKTLRKAYSGGAPIPPSTLDAFEEQFDQYIHNIYGLTETTSPAIAVPVGKRSPVSESTGATSVGVPVYDTVVRILDDEGEELPLGEVGEVAISGPQVVAGYWNRPDATAHSIPNGELHTGDVGYMDADGWFYIVDRIKDQINTSGFKVWPREVEDVLYEHPAVLESVVVGVPDSYRGETVKAFVSLQPGTTVTPEELIDHCKARMAAYKYPREVQIVDEIPKTATGKLLRRAFRDTTATP